MRLYRQVEIFSYMQSALDLVYNNLYIYIEEHGNWYLDDDRNRER